MPIICRLISLPQSSADALVRSSQTLESAVESAEVYSGVYRYWHGIDYLLRKHSPNTPLATLLRIGTQISKENENIPGARVASSDTVSEWRDVLAGIEPDALAPFYDAAELDKSSIYPQTWVAWEEEFDPLGYTLEHYSYLQYFLKQQVAVGDAVLVYFTFERDETDD